MNGVQLHLHALTHTNMYLGVLSSHMQYSVWRVSRTTTLQQVCQSSSLRGTLQKPLLTSVYRHLGGRNENQLCKDFCPINNKWTNYLHISVQHSDNLRMSHYQLMHPQSSCLAFTSFNILSTCLVSKRSLKQCNSTLNIKSISLEAFDSSMSLFITLSCS